jgi:hypothetical protein
MESKYSGECYGVDTCRQGHVLHAQGALLKTDGALTLTGSSIDTTFFRSPLTNNRVYTTEPGTYNRTYRYSVKSDTLCLDWGTFSLYYSRLISRVTRQSTDIKALNQLNSSRPMYRLTTQSKAGAYMLNGKKASGIAARRGIHGVYLVKEDMR